MKEVFLCSFIDSWAIEHSQIANFSERLSTMVGVKIKCEGLGFDPVSGIKMFDHPFDCHIYSHYQAIDHNKPFTLLKCPFLDLNTDIPEDWLKK